jgi:DNA-binding GntR family transcriptional regulator
MTDQDSTTESSVTSAPDRAPVALELPTYKMAVYERLRDMIGSFELPPGTRLVETDLAGKLGVSKTPVREAVALLEADGLVEVFPYRGANVRWLSVSEMLEQGYLIDALEMPAYPIVVERISDGEVSEIGEIAAQLRRARRVRDQGRYAELAVAIHERLFACTGFPRLQKLIRMVLGPVGLRYDRVLSYPFDDAWDLLTEISVGRYEAIRDRDAQRAVEMIRRLRSELEELALERVKLPEIARYFREPR